MLRVILAIVLSRGSQNEVTINQAKRFLIENRRCMVGFFKRKAKIGEFGGFEDEHKELDDIVEYYVLLITLTGFLEFEEEQDGRGHKITKGFS